MTNEFSLVVDFGLFPLDWSIPIARTVMIFNVPVMLFRVKTSYNVSSRKDQCGSFLFCLNNTKTTDKYILEIDVIIVFPITIIEILSHPEI